MRNLSPIEAITPAIERTKLVLFSPYRFGRTWKIAATAYVSMIGLAFFPWPLAYLLMWFHIIPQNAVGAFKPLILALALAATALFIGIFMLCSKLRFALFGMVLHREPMVAPAWRAFGAAALPWTLFKMVIGSLATLLVAVPFMRMVMAMIPIMAMKQPRPGQPFDPQQFHAIMAIYVSFFGLYLAMGVFMWLLSIVEDFVAPSLILERVSISEAFRRFALLARQETTQVLGYSLMKLLLAVAGFLVAMIAFYLALIVVILALVIIALVAGFLLHLLHVPSLALVILGCITLLPAMLVAEFYLMLLPLGAVRIFLEAYLQYFLGGRYPLLGEALDRSTPPPPMPFPGLVMYPQVTPPTQ